MPQSINEKSNPRHTPTSGYKRQESPITGLSPNDPIEVVPEGTGKKPAPLK